MKLAEVASLRSHDIETRVGCVLVDEDTDMSLASACNGFAKGVCDHRLPNTKPDKYNYIIHSEMNMLVSCAKQGISTTGKYLVCTMTPCCSCMRALYQAGISRIIAKSRYRDFEQLRAMKDLEITQSVTEEGFIELKYKPKLAKIVFVGCNPCNKSPDNSAFHPATSSGKKIRSWVDGLDVDVIFLNIFDEKTPLNTKPTKKQIQKGFDNLVFKLREIEPDLLVTVGDTAREVLNMYQCKRHHMPHPSGLSRFWNDKEKAKKAVSELRELILKV